uniref:Bifunctional lysine-specific demethylase and histidyl-hydroxylase n=1 Tax=Ceratitis capitata TaxID=7213 RepID=W8AWA9_CERCA
MSEPISAFAAYRSTSSKNSKSNKKTNNKKAGGATGGTNKGGVNKNNSKNKSLLKDKSKTTPKQHTETKPNVDKEKVKPVKAKEATKDQLAPKAERTKSKGASNKAAKKSEPVKQKHKVQHTATNGKAETNGINESEIDKLVDQLLADSPSKPKKLTKAQQKKKQDLEEYLVKELEKDDEDDDVLQEDVEGEEESEYDSEEDYSTGSDEFSDEYTINSYSDYDDEESDEGEESGAETEEENAPAATSTKSNAASKRKNNDAITSKQANDMIESKKARIAEKASDKRKSLPATAATAANDKSATKQKDKRRNSLAEHGGDAATTSSNTKIDVKTVDAKLVKMEPLSPPNNVVKMNSIQEGEKVFNWLLSPLAIKEFFEKYWESGACLVKRKGSNYYSHLISFEAIDQMLLKNHVEFTKNIDITSYKNGERETLNPVGRAMPPVVWDHYGQGCSIRLLNPQTFLPELFKLNTTLQEYFHCLVGANAYLTPPNSQGFAPHYDDIEAFVLQIEGRKRWRLYKPRTQAEQLPRFSSKNFSQKEIGTAIFDEVLGPGDMLYFPRGTIHQASTEPGYHSLHITLSVYQKQSYADLFERIMPLVLQRAIENNIDMRRGLPLHTFQHAGIAFSDNDTKERADLLRKVTKLMGLCLHSAQLHEVMDAAVDQLAKKYQHEALPPHVLPSERARTIFGSRSGTNEKGECMCDYEIDERTNVRPLRANIMRLVQEEEKVRIYYYLDNSKEYCEYDPNFIEIEPDEAASVEVLIRSYPEYVGVSQLPLQDDERKIQMVTALWERGLLMTEKPFK